MGLIQLSSVLLSLCLLFPCVVCSIITRCTHTLFGWWWVLGTISFHLKCCAADLQKKKIITHCSFCPQSLPSRQLQIDLYVSTSFTSAPSSRPPVAGSLRVTPSKRSTFQITDCICPADLISLQSPCRADQKPFKDLFMKRYLTYSISPCGSGLSAALDDGWSNNSCGGHCAVHRHLCLHLYFTRPVSVKILPNATPRFWYLNLTSALWAINKISAQKHSQFIILVWAG